MADKKPDLSWNFTQHAAIITEGQVTPFFKIASNFQGQTEFSEQINELSQQTDILTQNIRAEKSASWRDYQQVLPALGLSVSTKTIKEFTLTPIGHSFLDDTISFEDLITVQSLRYQYPNGGNTQHDIWKIQHSEGMQIKPGLLILNILFDLDDHPTHAPYITIDECQQAVIANKDNNFDISKIIALRNSGFKKATISSSADKKRRRNIQDWFKFLSQGRLFDCHKDKRGQYLVLTDYAKNNRSLLNELCKRAQAGLDFWEPVNFDKEDKLSWFDYFGSLPFLEAQLIETSGHELLQEEERGDAGDASVDIVNDPAEISLVEFSSTLRQENDEEEGGDKGERPSYSKSGVALRNAAHNYHDRIILFLGKLFSSLGLDCKADPNSLDLHVEAATADILTEVKTTTPQNLSKQIRTAVGQLKEYKFRIDEQTDVADCKPAVLAVVITSNLSNDSIYVRFLKSMGISLICYDGKSFNYHLADGAEFVESLLDKAMAESGVEF